jgi:hypothetical protein
VVSRAEQGGGVGMNDKNFTKVKRVLGAFRRRTIVFVVTSAFFFPPALSHQAFAKCRAKPKTDTALEKLLLATSDWPISTTDISVGQPMGNDQPSIREHYLYLRAFAEITRKKVSQKTNAKCQVIVEDRYPGLHAFLYTPSSARPLNDDISLVSDECTNALSAALLLDPISEIEFVVEKENPNPAAFPMDSDGSYRSLSIQLAARYSALSAIYDTQSVIGTLLATTKGDFRSINFEKFSSWLIKQRAGNEITICKLEISQSANPDHGNIPDQPISALTEKETFKISYEGIGEATIILFADDTDSYRADALGNTLLEKYCASNVAQPDASNGSSKPKADFPQVSCHSTSLFGRDRWLALFVETSGSASEVAARALIRKIVEDPRIMRWQQNHQSSSTNTLPKVVRFIGVQKT